MWEGSGVTAAFSSTFHPLNPDGRGEKFLSAVQFKFVQVFIEVTGNLAGYISLRVKVHVFYRRPALILPPLALWRPQ